jgi:hypothetical protein
MAIERSQALAGMSKLVCSIVDLIPCTLDRYRTFDHFQEAERDTTLAHVPVLDTAAVSHLGSAWWVGAGTNCPGSTYLLGFSLPAVKFSGASEFASCQLVLPYLAVLYV